MKRTVACVIIRRRIGNIRLLCRSLMKNNMAVLIQGRHFLVATGLSPFDFRDKCEINVILISLIIIMRKDDDGGITA